MSNSPAGRLRELDAAHHLHPFTNHPEMHEAGTHLLVRGEGVFLEDSEGRRLLDGLAGLWCVNAGYGRHEITDAVMAQMRELPYYCSFFNSTAPVTVELAAKLAELAPPRIHHTFFCNSGSEANETALKLIRNYWRLENQPQRTAILCREYAYHGVTLATTSMTGLPTCQEPFGLPLPGYYHAPAPYPYAVGFEGTDEEFGQLCVRRTRELIEKVGPDQFGAMFVEPVQGAGGVIVPPAGYLKAIRELCREFGILFVADEVITAFGRLGVWFASEMYELDPDMICFAKGVTSGYLPLGGTMVSDEIAHRLKHGGYLAHGYTYSGHPSAAAAALANIEYLENERILPKVNDTLGPLFQKHLHKFENHPAVASIRGTGLIGALELRLPGGAHFHKNTLGVRAAAKVREEGAIVRGIRDLVALAPPLVISESELDLLFSRVRAGLDKLAAGN